jgi:alcohol dehydrogenase/L-iditol 2-dehydrogenase
MRAAILTSAGVIEMTHDWPEPTCGRGDVIVEVTATGICGTDLAFVSGTRIMPESGLIVGHEPFGRIVAVGEDVDPARIGSRVVVEPNYPCGSCAPCLRGITSLCTARRSPVVNEHGFLAERVAVPADFAWDLPASISDEDAACIEPLAVALSALRRAGDLTHRPRIGITGAGAIGRILADIVVRSGVTPAITDPSRDRLSRAIAMGARPMQEGERFDAVFESSGAAAAATSAAEMLDPMGILVVVGVGNTPFTVNSTTVVRRGLTIVGSMIYDHPLDYQASIRLIVDGLAHPGGVLGEPFPLERASDALLGASDSPDKTWIRVADDA